MNISKTIIFLLFKFIFIITNNIVLYKEMILNQEIHSSKQVYFCNKEFHFINKAQDNYIRILF